MPSCHVLIQTYIFGAETHLGAGVMSVFVSLWLSAHFKLSFGSTALRKCPWRFWLHCDEL